MEHNGFEYVDLGLPSGTLWATCNVGADKPTDSGLFFQRDDELGATKNQLLNVGNEIKIIKTSLSNNNCVYRRDVWGGLISKEYMGGRWKMPTITQLNELNYHATSVKRTWHNGGSEYHIELTFKNGKSLVFPCCGFFSNASLYNGLQLTTNTSAAFLWYDGRNADADFFLVSMPKIETSHAAHGVFLNIRCVL